MTDTLLTRLRHVLIGHRMELTAGQLAGTHCAACARAFRPDEMVEDYGRTCGRHLYTHPAGTCPTAPRVLYSIGDPAIDALLTRVDPHADLYPLGVPGMAGTLDPIAEQSAPRATVTLIEHDGRQATSRPVPAAYAHRVAWDAATALHLGAIVEPVDFAPGPTEAADYDEDGA